MKAEELMDQTVAELRRLAREQGLVGASRMRKEGLVAALAARFGVELPALDPIAAELETQTVMQLRREAIDCGIRGAARMNKEALIEVLQPLRAALPEAGSSPSGPAPTPEVREQRFDFPDSYGVDRVVLLVRDPEYLYAYWDISGDTWAMLIQRGVTHPGKEWQRVLRVHDLTGKRAEAMDAETIVADLELDELAREWYFQPMRADRVYLVELGYRGPGGEFLVIARSNLVQVPRRQPSSDADERWGTLYDEAYRLSLAGADPTEQLGSAAVMRKLESLLAEGISSGLFTTQPIGGGSR